MKGKKFAHKNHVQAPFNEHAIKSTLTPGKASVQAPIKLDMVWKFCEL